MLKKIGLLFLLALAAGWASAQTTTVNMTAITDSDGTIWANGTWKVDFNPNPNTPGEGQYKQNGNPLNGTITHQQGSLNSAGSASFNVYDSSTITPVGSGWKLTVCPNASSPCGTYIFNTAGASVDVSSGVNSVITAPRFTAKIGAFGYNSTEAQALNQPGATYWDVTQGCQNFYNSLTLSWACTSASGAIPAGPAFAVNFANNAVSAFQGDTTFTYDPTNHIVKVQNSTSSANGVINPKAYPYNAVGDGVADDTAAFQLACSVARNTTTHIGGHIKIPPGTYKISDSINCTGGTSYLRSLHIEGSGMENTLFNCTLASGNAYPCFDFTGASQDAIIENFEVDGIAGGFQTAGMLLARSNTVAGGTGSDDSKVSHVRIDGNFGKAGLAGVSADTARIEDSSVQCAGPCINVIYWGALDNLGIPSKYQTFNTSSIAFTQVSFENDKLYYYNTLGGTVRVGAGAGAVFNFNGATGKISIAHTFGALNNTSGNVAFIRPTGGGTFQASLNLDDVRSENNNGQVNYGLDLENGEQILGGKWDYTITSTNTAFIPFYTANSAMIAYVTPANLSVDQNFTWTGGDSTGVFQNNTFNFQQGFGTWGTAWNQHNSYGNTLTTTNKIGPLPGFSAGGTMLSGIVQEVASSSLYGFNNNYIGTAGPWNICNANASLTSCTPVYYIDNTGVSTQNSDANIGGNANITNLMHSQQAVVNIPGASASLGAENLTNPNLTSGTSWTAGTSVGGQDCTVIGNPTTCTYTAGNTQGSIIQGAPSMAIAPKLSTAYYFCYTVTASTLVAANGDNAFILNDVTQFVHQAINVYLPVTVGTHCVDIVSSSTTINSFTLGFNINTVGASVTFGTLTLKQNLNAVSLASGNVSAGGTVSGAAIQVAGGTPITSQSSNNSQIVTCPPGGTSTQYCAANGTWQTPSGGTGSGITQLTGDINAGPGSGSVVAILPNVNANTGSCGDSTHVCQATFNAKGQTTAAAQVAIAFPSGIANTQISIGSFAIPANTCYGSTGSTTPATATMTGLTTTSVPFASYSGNPSAITGWGTTGGLSLQMWPTANTLNYLVCNATAASITGGAITLNVGAR